MLEYVSATDIVSIASEKVLVIELGVTIARQPVGYMAARKLIRYGARGKPVIEFRNLRFEVCREGNDRDAHSCSVTAQDGSTFVGENLGVKLGEVYAGRLWAKVPAALLIKPFGS